MGLAFDIHKLAIGVIAVAPIVIATDTTTVGLTIDTALFGAIEFMAFTGVLTDGDYEVKLFESDDSGMSGETEVTDENDLIGSLPDFTDDTDDAAIEQFGYIGSKRYLRCKIVSTSTSTGALIGIIAVKGHPRHAA